MNAAADISALLARGLAHHQAGLIAEAEADYRAVLAVSPEQPDALHLCGVVAYQRGQREAAIGLYRRALAAQPVHPAALNNLAAALNDAGRPAEARDAAERALIQSPGFVEALNTLGNALLSLGDAAAAADAYRRAIALRPDFADAHGNLGNACRALGRHEDAVAAYGAALARRAAYPQALAGLADALCALGRLADAAEAYRRLVALAPGSAAAHNDLGAVLQDLGRHDEAVDSFRRAVALDPGFALAHANLANLHFERGAHDDAVAALDAAIALAPPDAAVLRLRRALMLPAIMDADPARIAARRADVEDAVDALLADPAFALPPPDEEVAGSAFYLPYHGENDRPLQQKIARLHVQACPSLAWASPHCRAPAAPRERLRLGILSFNLFDHTIGRLNQGLIETLPRDRLEVVLLRPPGRTDAVSRAIDAAADRVVALPGALAPMREAIAAEAPDILFYPDIGMDALTYCVAMARLASVQCVTWGHPVTTGIPAMDYFVSGIDLEPPDADDHYSERLIRLDGLPACYRRPPPPQPGFDRAHYGLPAGATLYACPQTLFKFHPEFDRVLGAILRGDPDGILVLVGGRQAQWDALLHARFSLTIPDVAGRVVFLRPMARAAFVGLLACADVLLDPFPFGSGNSAYEAFAVAAPVVTLPGRFMRGRVTHALYRRMGFDGCTARDPDDYVRRALALGRDPGARAAARAAIAARAGAIFDDVTAAGQLARFFVAAAEAARRAARLAEPPR
ncbi:MAG: tetratricopeptide repeat protein [Rhodospirillales bacterium]